MTDEWVETTLGEVADWSAGGTPKSTEATYYEHGSVPWATISDVRNRPIARTQTSITQSGLDAIGGVQKVTPPGSVLLTMYGSVGRSALVCAPMATNQAIARGVPKADLVSSAFLACLLSHHQNDFDALARGATQRNINKGMVQAFRVSRPPRPVQERIVALIGSMDNQITALESERESLFEAHSAVIGSVMSDPANTVRELGSFLDLEVDTVWVADTSTYRVAGVLGYGLGLIDKGEILGAETSYARLNRLSTDRLVMRKLTAWEGPITVVEPEFDDTFASTEFPTFRVDGSLVSPAFLRHVCRWPGLWHEMKQRVTGSVQRRKRLNPEQLLAVGLRFPDLPIQVEVAAALDAMLHGIDAIRDEAEALRSVRSATLSALLDRELEIPYSFDDLLTEKATA